MEGLNAARVCKESPEYEAYIDRAARSIYDINALGDIRALRHKFDCAIAHGANPIVEAKAALSTGNPYDAVYTAEDLRKEDEEQDGFVGIGVILKQGVLNKDTALAQKDTEVVKPLPGTPAKAAGLREKDVIEKVDGKSVIGKDFHEVVNQLHGPLNSQVELTIIRDGAEKSLTIKRNEIKEPDAVTKAKNLGENINYIHVNSFDDGEVSDRLKQEIASHPEAKGFVIDVRDNQGGLVDQSLQAAELFVKKGTLMTMTTRIPSDWQKPEYSNVSYFVDNKNFYEKSIPTMGGATTVHAQSRVPFLIGDRPVVLLTNELTASAAELFIGALHDTQKFTTVGEKTFGKGIGQTFYRDLPGGGALKITDMRYQTPSGTWPGDANTNRIGLEPDVKVHNPIDADFGSARDLQLAAALRLVKEKLKR